MAWHLSGGGIKAPQNANDYRREIYTGFTHHTFKGTIPLFLNSYVGLLTLL